MSKLLKQAVEELEKLPARRQDEIGQMLLDVVDQDQRDIQLSPEQVAEVQRRVDDPNPVFATDEQVEEFFGRFAN